MWGPKKVSESRKSLQIQKTYEALFALEDIREIFRQSLPAGFDESQQEEFSNTITKIKSIISDLENGEGKPACNRVGKLEPRTREEEFINIHPIQQRAGLRPRPARPLYLMEMATLPATIVESPSGSIRSPGLPLRSSTRIWPSS